MMQARMPNVYKFAQGGYRGLQAVEDYLDGSRIPRKLLELVRIRASQINGCSVCVDLHSHRAHKAGERDERLWSVGAWRDTPFFTDAERAALALTEAITRITDNPGGVPDEVWNQAASHFADEDLAALVMAIASINAWNRINVTARLVAGTFR
ncbi:carboxymuconolactone decarboxylase family protein [Nocardia abscessus]|uniref:carboxymuconolactone decarboxylase family protein n=1 Tax=Nocardia abscessus TaxID=120957 RepID=UPI0024582810|nr:carboxymuconolactone decarboxylase family protein [Nocardia abscessus]